MILMLIGAKLYILGSIAIAGLFLLAKKALIIGKIALLISGIIALKKLVASKHEHGGYEVSVVHDSGHGGWHGGGGGWHRRSQDAQDLAYNSYNQNQQ